MKRFLWLGLALFLLTGCGQAREILVTFAYNNLSDSYVYPYRISVNGKYGAHPALVECSNGTGAGALIMKPLPEPPRFLLVEWEHLVTRKVYRAKIPLSDAGGQWWRRSPFRDAQGRPYPKEPVLVVQWRGPRQVAAMLVANFTDFSAASLDLGVAEGEEIPRPEWGPNLEITYTELTARRKGRVSSYKPGEVYEYERRYDGKLSRVARFGCPRTDDGRLDKRRLPPRKLPFMLDENGKPIPCEADFCADKSALRKRLEELGWKEYPVGAFPGYFFKEPPDTRNRAN